jgi:isopenicillin-N epimerase
MISKIMDDEKRLMVPRSEWLLDPDILFLNHGSYGAVPRVVFNEQRRLQERMERNPGEFLVHELPAALRAAANDLARFIQGSASDLAFVENATAGCNTVLASMQFSPGDEILVTNHGYPAIRKAAQYFAARAGASVVEVAVPFPTSDPIQIINAVATRLGRRSRLAIFDHVTSPTAVVFPVRELSSICHEAGAMVLIDGAHAPGMLSLDVPTIGADWYVGNCHKWLMAPKGSGFLWASPARHAETHPLVISHGFGQGFETEFDWVGTRDPTAWLTVPAAIDFHHRSGGHLLRERNMRLARQASNLLVSRWKSERGTIDALTGSMSTVRLPMDGEVNDTRAFAIRHALREEHRIDAAVIAFNGAFWMRLSAQAYNEMNDYARLAEAFSN